MALPGTVLLAAVSILAEYESEERAGTLTREQAQRGAITRLRYLRYGEDGKDYFFHRDSLQSPLNFDRLNGGERVSFDVQAGPKGPRAANVREGDAA